METTDRTAFQKPICNTLIETIEAIMIGSLTARSIKKEEPRCAYRGSILISS